MRVNTVNITEVVLEEEVNNVQGADIEQNINFNKIMRRLN